MLLYVVERSFLLDTGGREHLGGNGRSQSQKQLFQLLSSLVGELTLLCRLEHVSEQGQKVSEVRLDKVLTLFKQQEDSIENGLVLDKVLGERQAAEPKRKNLIQRQGGVVLDNHSCNATSSVVLGVKLIGSRGVIDLEEC